MVNLLQDRHACTTAPKAGTLPWRLVSWSRSRDKTKTKTLTSKTEAKAKTSTFKTKVKAKAPKSKTKTKTKAVKICLEAALKRGTASRYHITSLEIKYYCQGVYAKVELEVEVEPNGEILIELNLN